MDHTLKLAGYMDTTPLFGSPLGAARYYQELDRRRDSLFGLYAGLQFKRKYAPRGRRWTWGYRLFDGDQRIGGSSVGDDEIRILMEIPALIDARYSYCIGVAFGLSTFCIALGKPEQIVFAIDSYQDKGRQRAAVARNLVERIISERLPQVRLFVGSSPGDTPACLAELPAGEKLSLVFIDGEHTNEAAAADFNAILGRLDEKSVVLWHNVDRVADAFHAASREALFDTSAVLRCHGPMGILFNRGNRPELKGWIASTGLIWEQWQKDLAVLTVPPQCQHTRLERFALRLVRPLDWLLGRRS